MHVSLNLIHYKIFTISIGSEAFLIEKFRTDGTLKKYLDENCDNKEYRFCKYKDCDSTCKHKDNFLSISYLWDINNSLLHRIGVLQMRAESKKIIKNIILEYPFLVLTNLIKTTGKQLKSFHIQLDPISSHTSVEQAIRTIFQNDYQSYRESLQNTNSEFFRIDFFNSFYAITFYFSIFLSCIFFLFALWEKNKLLMSLFILIAATLIFNAAITGGLSGVFDRYQSRVIWLVPLYALIGGFHFIETARYRKLFFKRK
jgi:hypothetical protein